MIIGNLEVCDFAQGTAEWHEARAGRVTGTRLSLALSSKKSTRDGLIHTLIYEKVAPHQDEYQSDIMARGHLIESVVKELYAGKMRSIGFLKRTDNDFIGLSPDAIGYGEDGIIREALEVKGPMGKAFIEYWLFDGVPNDYFWQVVHYFVVIETLERLHFVVHNPNPHDILLRTKIHTVTREELQPFIMQATIGLANFQAEYLDAFRSLLDAVNSNLSNNPILANVTQESTHI